MHSIHNTWKFCFSAADNLKSHKLEVLAQPSLLFVFSLLPNPGNVDHSYLLKCPSFSRITLSGFPPTSHITFYCSPSKSSLPLSIPEMWVLPRILSLALFSFHMMLSELTHPLGINNQHRSMTPSSRSSAKASLLSCRIAHLAVY